MRKSDECMENGKIKPFSPGMQRRKTNITRKPGDLLNLKWNARLSGKQIGIQSKVLWTCCIVLMELCPLLRVIHSSFSSFCHFSLYCLFLPISGSGVLYRPALSPNTSAVTLFACSCFCNQTHGQYQVSTRNEKWTTKFKKTGMGLSKSSNMRTSSNKPLPSRNLFPHYNSPPPSLQSS